MTLEQLTASARDARPAWDEARASRVLSSTLLLRERRTARGRLTRRALGVVSVAATVVVVLLKGATAPAGASTTVEPSVTMLAAQADPLANNGDGGYGRD